MKKNDNDVWTQRGEGLTEPAFADDQNVTPSSLRIPQYVLLIAWKWITTIVTCIWSFMKNLSGDKRRRRWHRRRRMFELAQVNLWKYQGYGYY